MTSCRAIIYPAYREDCDFAVIFIEVSGCLPMCGAGTIGLVTAAIEEGLVTPRVQGKLSIETPAGKVDINTTSRANSWTPSGCSTLRAICMPRTSPSMFPAWANCVVDISYGGNYYAVVEPQSQLAAGSTA
jgi:4-hydroxyproline epimerase